MTDYVLLSDSTTDLPAGMAADLDVEIVPLSYIIDHVVYDDVWGGSSADGVVSPAAHEFYDMMRQGTIVTSSQINAQRFITVFEPYLKAAQDIVFLAFSSGMSGTYEQALHAKAQLLARYPERRISVIDSLTASMGEGLFLTMAANRRADGASFDELVDYMLAIRMQIHGWVTVDDLIYLKRSGRLNAPSAIFGNLLNLKPIIWGDGLGRLTVYKKVRGHKQALLALVERVAKLAHDPTDNPIFFSHTDCIAVVDELKAMLVERFGTKQFVTSFIGPVIGSHIGPGTVGLYFFGKDRLAAEV